MGKQRLVVGFLFDTQRKHVVLIRKAKPKWQKGKLNGIGGKVKRGEQFFQAMEREFWEETAILFKKWELYGIISNSAVEVRVYKGFRATFRGLTSKTKEAVGVYPTLGLLDQEMVYNVFWLVFAALDNNTKFIKMVVVNFGRC